MEGGLVDVWSGGGGAQMWDWPTRRYKLWSKLTTYWTLDNRQPGLLDKKIYITGIRKKAQ